MKTIQRFNFAETEDPKEMARNLRHIQDSVIASVNPLLLTPVVDGRIITGVSIANTATAVNHGLGRLPLGWVVITKDTANHVFEATADRLARTDKHLRLTASATTIVDLWVF